MKKFLIAAMIVSIMFAYVGCGSDSGGDDDVVVNPSEFAVTLFGPAKTVDNKEVMKQGGLGSENNVEVTLFAYAWEHAASCTVYDGDDASDPVKPSKRNGEDQEICNGVPCTKTEDSGVYSHADGCIATVQDDDGVDECTCAPCTKVVSKGTYYNSASAPNNTWGFLDTPAVSGGAAAVDFAGFGFYYPLSIDSTAVGTATNETEKVEILMTIKATEFVVDEGVRLAISGKKDLYDGSVSKAVTKAPFAVTDNVDLVTDFYTAAAGGAEATYKPALQVKITIDLVANKTKIFNDTATDKTGSIGVLFFPEDDEALPYNVKYTIDDVKLIPGTVPVTPVP